ncbi:hypothetical protein ASG90_07725 [Nocardioides sp. Soil797]|nr:hypothetical protein ASG90_07725 [Nocardioides sp. Soil797]
MKALAADLVLVLVFAAAGRAEHDKGNVILGVLDTAWPFLVGAGIGWLLVRQLGKREAIGIGPGITVWISTVLFGMVLRQLSGDGTAFSFIVVATLVLGVFLVGWRALARLLANRKATQV